MNATWLHHLTHPHGMTLTGEARYLTHRADYEPCGCLIANVETLGHRSNCRNAPTADLYRVTWRTETGPHHTEPLTLTDALRRFEEIHGSPGRYSTHLTTEALFRAAVADHARKALAS